MWVRERRAVPANIRGPMRLPRCALGFALIVLQLVCAATAGCAAGAQADIEVAGLRTISAEAVRDYLRFSAGDADDARMIDASLKTLMATGLFADVRIERRQSRLVITVVENLLVATVIIEGQSAIEKKIIASHL